MWRHPETFCREGNVRFTKNLTSVGNRATAAAGKGRDGCKRRLLSPLALRVGRLAQPFEDEWGKGMTEDRNTGCAQTPMSDHLRRFAEQMRDAEWRVSIEKEFHSTHWSQDVRNAVAALVDRGVETGSAIESPREMSTMQECVEALKRMVNHFALLPAEYDAPNSVMAEARSALSKLEKANG